MGLHAVGIRPGPGGDVVGVRGVQRSLGLEEGDGQKTAGLPGRDAHGPRREPASRLEPRVRVAPGREALLRHLEPDPLVGELPEQGMQAHGTVLRIRNQQDVREAIVHVPVEPGVTQKQIRLPLHGGVERGVARHPVVRCPVPQRQRVSVAAGVREPGGPTAGLLVRHSDGTQ